MNYQHLLSVNLNNLRVTKGTTAKTASVHELVKDLRNDLQIRLGENFQRVTQGLLQIVHLMPLNSASFTISLSILLLR